MTRAEVLTELFLVRLSGIEKEIRECHNFPAVREEETPERIAMCRARKEDQLRRMAELEEQRRIDTMALTVLQDVLRRGR